MRLNLYNFLGSYNKAYKSKQIDENGKDFKNFINKIKIFYEHTSTIELTNEELLKDKFKECVLNEYQTFANENRVDLAIKKDGKTQVICEFKKPSNKNEMIQIGSEDTNKKALQEAIWYFYNQDSLETSYQIKNIIITDTESFFFFNPKSFCNKDFEKICIPYRNKQLAYENTKILYEQIGAKIKEKNLNFDYAEFNLKQYREKILNGTLKENDIKQLKYFYKALHKDFLLREFSSKDSNELNSKFYNELLYILGLKEEGKTQKIIKPSEQKGTLRDCIYNELFISEKEKFEASINLIIVWLNRILFLKLFESQLVSFNDSKDFAFLTSEKINNFNLLNQLFFNVLGKQERAEQYKTFNYIPYLNSSLFEISKYESQYDLKISGLNIDAKLALFKGSVLSEDKNYPKNPNLLKYLLDFLNYYKFNSNISETNDNKDIINSSVLGLIFEKLNGYKDGSFFTPAYITEYMSEQAINKIVLQNFNQIFDGEKALCKTIENLKDLLSYDSHIKERRDYYNEIIDNLKICDPAVGSGHFLVSILNYLIHLKSYLGILNIKNQIDVQNDSLVIYELNGETQFQYKRNDKNTLLVQKAIFEEKRKIIENCLFGVDINPNSVQICCLRLWIELLKNTYYIDNSDDMQVLPNIDINIKEGNSLVSSYKVKVGHCAIEELDGRTTEAKSIKEYKNLVSDYKNTESKVSKTELRNQIKIIKDKIFPIRQLKLFEDNSSQGVYINSMEWMIEFPELLDENGIFKGFDCIIGNPPYMRIQQIQKTQPLQKEYYEDGNYQNAVGSYDLANLFVELGINLSKPLAKNIFIMPHKFLNSTNAITFREYLLTNKYVDKIAHFGANMIFSNADTYTCILEYSKQRNEGILFQKFPFKSNYIELMNNANLYNYIDYSKIKNASKLYGSNQWILFNNDIEFEIFSKIYKNKLKNLDITFKEIFQGIATSKDDLYISEKVFEDDEFYILKLLINNIEYKVEKALFKPILKGEDVHRYSVLSTNKYVFFPYELTNGEAKIVNIDKMKECYPLTYQYIMNNEAEFKKRENNKASKMDNWYAYIYPKNLNKFEQLKLTSMEICSKHPNVTLNKENYYHNTKVYSFIKNSETQESYEYLLAILNSKILWWFLKNTGDTLQGDARTMKTEYLKPFPLSLKNNKEYETKLIDLVNNLLSEKQKNDFSLDKCSEYEKQINKLVYELYDLNDEEIKIIEEV